MALGKAGSGKTVLGAGLIENAKAAFPDQSFFYFFFSSLQPATNTSSAAYRAILSQALHKHIDNSKLVEKILFSMYFGLDGQLSVSNPEAGDLFELCLQLPELENSTIVLDGLDECEDVENNLMPRLTRLVSQTRIKTVFLGRSSVQRHLKNIPDVIELQVGHLNTDDIRLYLQDELATAVDEGLLPKTLNQDVIAQRLSSRANGMFLWARLMMAYLRSPGLLMSERREAISTIDLPEGLEKMYERILKHMARAGKASLRLACFIFMCLVYMKSELSIRELEDAVISRKRGGIDEPSRHIPNFVDNVLSVCGGFVEKTWTLSPTGQRKTSFRFIHISVMEYLMTEPERKEKGTSIFEDMVLLPAPQAAHTSLATLLVEYIIYALPKQVLSSQHFKDNLLAEFPLSCYAAMHWPGHMLAANGDPAAIQMASSQHPHVYADFVSALCQLLSNSNAISTWIQTCYVFHEIPPYVELAYWVEGASQPDFPWRRHISYLDDIIPNVESLGLHLQKVVADWGAHLARDPGCVWEEVGAFDPTAFSTAPRGTTVRKLISGTKSSTIASEAIHKISQLMPNGEHDYVLSVFPGK